MSSISLSATVSGDRERMRSYLEAKRQQDRNLLAKTMEYAKQSPVPWPHDLVDCICMMMDDDFEDVLMHHPGHALSDAHDSVVFCLKLFNAACKELDSAIMQYQSSCNDPDFFSYRRNAEHDHAIFVLNRCVYHVASAADALRNFSMKQAKHFIPENYEKYKKACFEQNNLHHFIQKLRGALHHEHFVMASPRVTWGGNHTHEMTLYLDTRKLLRLEKIREKRGAREYVEGSGARIDVQEAFRRYAIIVNEFHNWLLGEMDTSPEFTDYRRCLLERKRRSKRMTYSIFLREWIAKGIDPYAYLDKYLDGSQIALVKKLPHRSREQVDKIISLIDKDGACNDEIRTQAYELFKAAS